MSSTPEANSPTAQLTKLSLSTAALPRYQFDQLKAETLLRQFLPGIDVDIQMTAERIAVTVMTSHPLQSIELWSGLTRSLALQLGVEVELRRCADVRRDRPRWNRGR